MSEATQQFVIWLIPAAPLLAAIVTALFGPKLLRENSQWPCWIALGVSALCSFALLLSIVPNNFSGPGGSPVVATGYQFLDIGGFNVRVDLQADAMTAIMLSMVTFVSFLVSMFGAGYMKGDPGFPRFFAEISLFVFSMSMLVLASNFLLLFVFWEAVGLCSYLLIGFWFQKPSAAAAAKKAFVVNRIGDFGFVLAIFLIWTNFGSLTFADTLGQPAKLAAIPTATVTTICLLLFLGAMGKSAQFPLMVWLPDAMEGPTPVSALIHAATMVTAGVYLLARATPLFLLAPTAQMIVSGIGATTALIAALTALTQTDLKRVLAYSTVSQLGYMFMALGAGVPGAEAATVAATAGMFHLFTHAFFKALLFLAAGSVMHAMGDVIDMRRFSGLKKALPITHWTFLCGAVALAGVPPLSGFWSKDDILAVLAAAGEHSSHGTFYGAIQLVAMATALLTAFYTFRAYFMTFWGEERFPEEAGHHPHEATPVMAWPLRILAVCSLLVGVGLGPTHLFAEYLHHTPGHVHVEPHGLHWDIMIVSSCLGLVGIAFAWLFYVKSTTIPARIAAALGPLYTLSLNKFYLDEIFIALLVAPIRFIAWFSSWFDLGIVDKIVDGVGRIPVVLSRAPAQIQNGLVSTYSLVMLGGAVAGVLLVLRLVM
ncbi:MAG: NADH-quinone oxidoreductase subunit L [Pirellulales bacterium]